MTHEITPDTGLWTKLSDQAKRTSQRISDNVDLASGWTANKYDSRIHDRDLKRVQRLVTNRERMLASLAIEEERLKQSVADRKRRIAEREIRMRIYRESLKSLKKKK